MTRSELRDDSCYGCGASLSAADHVEPHEMVYATGEYAGEPGIVVVAECSCGHTSVIPLSVDLRRAA